MYKSCIEDPNSPQMLSCHCIAEAMNPESIFRIFGSEGFLIPSVAT